MKRIVLAVLTLITLSGCSTYFSYQGVKYNNQQDALTAQSQVFSSVIDQITPLESPLIKSPLLAANYSKISAERIISLHNNNRLLNKNVLAYLSAAQRADWNMVVEAINKSNIFTGIEQNNQHYSITSEYPAKPNMWTLSFRYVVGVGERFVLHKPNMETRLLSYNQSLESPLERVSDLVNQVALQAQFNDMSDGDSTVNLPQTNNTTQEITINTELSIPTVALLEPIDFNGVGKWDISTKEDPITDELVVTALLKSEDFDITYNEKTAMLVRCNNGNVDIFISYDDYLGSDSIRTVSRVDKDEPITTNWSLSTNNQAAFYPKDDKQLILRLFAANQFVVRATPYNENPKTLIFDVRGIFNGLQPYSSTCQW